jgi:hypothetical protein
MFQAVRMMNGMDYTSLGLTKLCLQPGIQFRLQAAAVKWNPIRRNGECFGEGSGNYSKVSARKEE